MASHLVSATAIGSGDSRRSSRSSSGSTVSESTTAAAAAASPAGSHFGSIDRLSDFDLGSFTLITDDDLNFERHAENSSAAHRDGASKASPAHPQSSSRMFSAGGLQLALHGRGHRGRVKERNRSSRFHASGASAQADAVKSKLQAAWNRVKYGWLAKSRATFGGSSPIVLLGNIYINHVLPADEEDDRDVEQLSGEVCSLPVSGDYSGSRVTAAAASSNNLEAFYLDFESRIWLTYRRDFPRIGDSGLTTDCGWGCMLRCGQMALAQGLVVHLLGREWRKPLLAKRRRSSGSSSSSSVRPAQPASSTIASVRNASAEGVLSSLPVAGGEDRAEQEQRLDERHVDFCYRFIVSCFIDSPSAHAPFSLHRLVQLGSHFGKKAGDWYGPGSTAHILQDAVARSSLMYPIFGDLCVYVARDCTIYKQDVVDLCRQQRRPSASAAHRMHHVLPCGRGASGPGIARSNASAGSVSASPSVTQEASSPGAWRSVIIFVPMRLGGERMNELYVQCLQGLLSLEHCIGIMGGRPRHSLYFVGFQDEQLIYLDPHLCQDSVVDKQQRAGGGGGAGGRFDTSTYHCPTPRKLAFADMDPSCTIGFYCRDEADFKHFLETIEPYLILPGQRSRYPLFVIDEGSVQQTTASLTSRASAAAAVSSATATHVVASTADTARRVSP